MVLKRHFLAVEVTRADQYAGDICGVEARQWAPKPRGCQNWAPAHPALVPSSSNSGRIFVHGKSRVKLVLFGEGRGGVGYGCTSVQGDLNPEHH